MTTKRSKVFLFIDESEESREALEAFQQTDVDLVVILASGTNLPSAKIENIHYNGKRGVNFLIQGMPKRPNPQSAM